MISSFRLKKQWMPNLQGLLWYWRYAPLLIVGLYIALPFHMAVDFQQERCLQDHWLYLQLEKSERNPARGDLVFWPPEGALSYVKSQYAGKRVAGIEGDIVRVDQHGSVYVNNHLVGAGFPLASMYKVPADYFYGNTFRVPKDQIFVIGDHPKSNDSRYWGTLDTKKLKGQMWGIL